MPSDGQADGAEQWESIEPLSGDYCIGHSTGSLCYLIDEDGDPRSEGYHSIRSKRATAGPPGNIKYVGKRGASEHRISPIPKRYVESNE